MPINVTQQWSESVFSIFSRKKKSSKRACGENPSNNKNKKHVAVVLKTYLKAVEYGDARDYSNHYR